MFVNGRGIYSNQWALYSQDYNSLRFMYTNLDCELVQILLNHSSHILGHSQWCRRKFTRWISSKYTVNSPRDLSGVWFTWKAWRQSGWELSMGVPEIKQVSLWDWDILIHVYQSYQRGASGYFSPKLSFFSLIHINCTWFTILAYRLHSLM